MQFVLINETSVFQFNPVSIWIFLSQSSLDVSLSSISGENKNYGTPTNPTAPALIPGGSSSGSAVAVAADLVHFSLGKLLTNFKTHAFSFTCEVNSYLLSLMKIVSKFLLLCVLLFYFLFYQHSKAKMQLTFHF